MPISKVRLQDFRSYTDTSFALGKGVNVVVGPNGSGKTNLLEALYVLARGKSFRVADSELVRHGQDWARLEANVDESQRILTIKKTDVKVEKRLQVDGHAKTRLSAREKLSVVLFEPRDMQLLTGSPDRRREFMDDVLEQLEAGYARTLAHYRRALHQRNTLLKQQQPVPADHMFVWNVRLSELGAQIALKRRELAATWQEQASVLYRQISGADASVAIVYRQQTAADDHAKLASVLLHALEKRLATDRQRGYTSVGPHRDDLEIVLSGKSASTSASRGETRSLVIMLKLLEANLLSSHQETPPLVLLDDVFGELDSTRRHALAAHFTHHQVVITATEADDTLLGAVHASKIITISDY